MFWVASLALPNLLSAQQGTSVADFQTKSGAALTAPQPLAIRSETIHPDTNGSGAFAQPAADGVAATSAAPSGPQPIAVLNLAAESASAPELAMADGGRAQVKEIYLDREAPIKQELIIEGLVSYGNYKIFASGYDEKLFTAGVEYDRHCWGHFLGSEMDYVAEVLPFVLLDKPLKTNIYGSPSYPIDASKADRQYVPGFGISPIGFRWQWRSAKKVRPYLEAKGGLLVFTKKVPSTEATYENFSLQSGTGLQVMMSQKWGLRLGLFGDFHFSNAFIVPINPGLDVMNANLGLGYHF